MSTVAMTQPLCCVDHVNTKTEMQCSEEGSGGEAYMSSPSVVWVTEDGTLAIGDMPSVGGYRGRRAVLQPKHTLPLALSESVLQVMLYVICRERLMYSIDNLSAACI